MSAFAVTDAPTLAEVREAALRLLARREHSRRELASKLTRRGWPVELVTDVTDALASENLQSDQRYAESYARSRVLRCYGPLRIRAELSERGISRTLTERALEEIDADWFALAADWYQRRYGKEPAGDMKEKARRHQALTRRGFSGEHIRELLN